MWRMVHDFLPIQNCSVVSEELAMAETRVTLAAPPLMVETGAVFGHWVNISNCSVETKTIRSLHPISSRDTRKYDQICQAKGKTKGKGWWCGFLVPHYCENFSSRT